MASRILAIGGLILLVGCAQIGKLANSWKYDADVQAACYWTNEVGEYGIDCTKVEEPQVVVTNVVQRWLGPGTLGFYTGEGIIFLWDGLPYKSATTGKVYTLEAVRVHETVHYLLDKYVDHVVTRCESEEIARKVTAAWEKEKYDPEWEARYNCGPRSMGIIIRIPF